MHRGGNQLVRILESGPAVAISAAGPHSSGRQSYRQADDSLGSRKISRCGLDHILRSAPYQKIARSDALGLEQRLMRPVRYGSIGLAPRSPKMCRARYRLGQQGFQESEWLSWARALDRYLSQYSVWSLCITRTTTSILSSTRAKSQFFRSDVQMRSALFS
jgi:hypothetical protein